MQNITRRQLLAVSAAAGGLALWPHVASAKAEDAMMALDKFTGGKAAAEGKVTLKMPEIAENGNTVPLSISFLFVGPTWPIQFPSTRPILAIVADETVFNTSFTASRSQRARGESAGECRMWKSWSHRQRVATGPMVTQAVRRKPAACAATARRKAPLIRLAGKTSRLLLKRVAASLYA